VTVIKTMQGRNMFVMLAGQDLSQGLNKQVMPLIVKRFRRDWRLEAASSGCVST